MTRLVKALDFRSDGHAFEPYQRHIRYALLVNQPKYVESTFVVVRCWTVGETLPVLSFYYNVFMSSELK